jgi:acyl-CoA thioester hydrolase
MAFPGTVHAGLRVEKLAPTHGCALREAGILRNDWSQALAQGSFVHALVERAPHRPTPLPQALRGTLEPLLSR